MTLYNEKQDIKLETFHNCNTVEERILQYCKTPKSKEEIARYLNINTPYYVVTKYLRPLTKRRKLAMTIPEKPKSKFQKYYKIK